MTVEIRPLTPEDHPWAHALIAESWGSTWVVSRGVLHDITVLPGFVAWHAGECVGLLTYRIAGQECEIMSLDSLCEGIGVGSALITAARAAAQAGGCERLWLITTNDNLYALRFYQRRGFVLAALHPNALKESRRLKPQIPLIGLDGIPLRDEIELEVRLSWGGEDHETVTSA